LVRLRLAERLDVRVLREVDNSGLADFPRDSHAKGVTQGAPANDPLEVIADVPSSARSVASLNLRRAVIAQMSMSGFEELVSAGTARPSGDLAMLRLLLMLMDLGLVVLCPVVGQALGSRVTNPVHPVGGSVTR
jgi:hypothetical protein